MEVNNQINQNNNQQSANPNKSETIVNAVFIGFLLGILIYSVAMNSFGFLSLIPLYLVYKLVKKPRGTTIK